MILLIAPVFDEYILKKYPATSAAASLWSNVLASNLSKYFDVLCVTAINNSLYPKGYLKINRISRNEPLKRVFVSYISLPFLRKHLIVKNIKDEIASFEADIDLVITYNATNINIEVGNYLKSRGVKWLMLYADANTDNQLISHADLNVYFSYSSYLRSICKYKFQFEGGVYNELTTSYTKTSNKIFLYTGIIRIENGVDLLIDAFKLINDLDAELVICGPGDYSTFKAKIEKDCRIKFLGLVNPSHLQKLYQEATCFLNPRLSSFEENKNNFPSKLLDYMAWGKPIISTFTDGINPIYKDYLLVPEVETSESISKLMVKVLQMTEDEKITRFNEIKKFVNEKYSFSNRVNDLLEWIKSTRIDVKCK